MAVSTDWYLCVASAVRPRRPWCLGTWAFFVWTLAVPPTVRGRRAEEKLDRLYHLRRLLLGAKDSGGDRLADPHLLAVNRFFETFRDSRETRGALVHRSRHLRRA
nr:hypothetical protein HmN_000091200 [Hymenolepis microstoma]